MTIDGMPPGAHDNDGIRFWPVGEVQMAGSELLRQNTDVYRDYLIFADYSLWAHAYGVHVAEGQDQVVIVGGDQPLAVAPSFSGFLAAYIDNARSIFGR